ncbi:MAG: P-II family nitrogen regulator [Bacillota bacterium]|nr:P-II family nitrogen regulator [Bacillota bacterium]
MDEMRFLIAVVRRERHEEYFSFFKHYGAQAVFAMLCQGTAQKKTLDLLGLERNEKMMLCCLATAADAELLMRRLVWDMRIDAPNAGMAITVAVQQMDKAAQDMLCHKGNIENCEVNKMNQTPHSLVIAIAEHGYSNMVMDAARSANARGGTIVPARGTGAQMASKFFGVSITDEKDLIYIVAKRDDRDNIMRAISEQAGRDSAARAVVFALPVESVTGLFDM